MDDRFSLRFETGERQGETVPVTRGGFSIGRRPGSSLQILDGSVSGKHAEIVIDDEGALLRDLGSTNGTRVRNQRVLETRLAHGDPVFLGNVQLTILDAAIGTPVAPPTPAEQLADPAPAPDDTRRPGLDETMVAAPAQLGEELGSVSADRVERSRKRPVLGMAVGAVVLLAGAGVAVWFFLLRGGGGDGAALRPVVQVDGNLIADGYSFEGDDDGWTADDTASAGFYEVAGARWSGAVGLEADLGPGEWAQHRSPGARVTAGRRLSAQARLRARGGTRGRVGIELTSTPDPSGESVGRAIAWGPVATDADGWLEVSVESPVPPGYDSAAVVVRGEAVDEPGDVAFDDAALVQIAGSGAPTFELTEMRFFLLGEPAREGLLLQLDEALLTGVGAYVEREVPTTTYDDDGNEVAGHARVRVPAELSAAEGEDGVVLSAAGVEADADLVVTLRIERVQLEQGVATIGQGGYRTHPAEFERADVTSLVVGSGRSLASIRFDAPVSLAGTSEDGAGRARFSIGRQRSFTIQLDFREERRKAEDLAHEARKAERDDDLGGTLRLWAALLDDHPYEAALVREAEESRQRLIDQGLDKVRELGDEVERARFFRLVDLFRQCRTHAHAIAARYAGSEVEEAALEVVAQVDQELAALESDLDADELARLQSILAILEAQEATGLAEDVRTYIAERFTAADGLDTGSDTGPGTSPGDN